jgi:hypothetical protein
MKQKHSAEVNLYPCQSQQCDKVFKRIDARLKHQRKHHPELGIQPAEQRLRLRSDLVPSSAKRNRNSPSTVESLSKEDQNGTSRRTSILINNVARGRTLYDIAARTRVLPRSLFVPYPTSPMPNTSAFNKHLNSRTAPNEPQEQHRIPFWNNNPGHTNTLPPFEPHRSETSHARISPDNALLAPSGCNVAEMAVNADQVDAMSLLSLGPQSDMLPQQQAQNTQLAEAHMMLSIPSVIANSQPSSLQDQVGAMLFQWLFSSSAHPPDELALLQNFRVLWKLGEAIFRPELDPLYDLTSDILAAWLAESSAKNDMRATSSNWRTIPCPEQTNPEDILIKAFCVITRTEHAEFIFKEGLSRVGRSVLGFPNKDGYILAKR